ncbi:MAG: carbohydrate-binding protein [Pontiella sp.]
MISIKRMAIRAALLTAGGVQAATIHWGTPSPVVDANDVSTTGSLLYAESWGLAAADINTIDFALVDGVNIVRSDSSTAGTQVRTDNVSSTITQSGSYYDLLRSIWYSADASKSIVLNDLTIGIDYQIQIWSSDTRYRESQAQVVDGVTLVTHVGQYVLGTFTAEAVTQEIHFEGTGSGILNAVQVRRLSPAKVFVHPGLSHKRSDLERMKYMAEAGIEPYASSYALLAAHARASYSVEVAGGYTGMTELDGTWNNFLKNDGITAYYNALMWMMTGDSRHAEKAIEVFTVWSDLKRNTQGVPLSTGRHWKLIEAAEIIKSTYDGWAEEDLQKFKDMLVYPGYSNTTVPTEAIANNDITFYWRIYQGDPARHGNQGIFAMRVMMAMGVFLDNEIMYDRAVRYLQGMSHRADDVPYVSGPSITTGPTAVYEYYEEYSRSGQEDTIPDYGYNEVISNYVYETGQCQESSRDQAHSLGGVGTLCTMAEIAWNQGDDLYGHLDNRLLLGLSFWYRYNLSWAHTYPDQTSPWEPTVESGEYVARFDRSGRWKALKINPYLTYNIGSEYWHRGRTNLLVAPILEATLGHYKDRMNLQYEETKWLERGFEFLTNEVGVEQLTTTDHAGLGGLKYRRVSPGDPIRGFTNGVPVYAMHTIPCTIEAENYDYFTLNGEGRTYHDLTPTNSGGEYRDDDVDITRCSEGGYALTDLENGEWLTYTVAVPTNGEYDISIRCAASTAGGKIQFSFDAEDKTGEIRVPASSSGWQDVLIAEGVSLSNRVQSMKIRFSGVSNAFELKSISIMGPFAAYEVSTTQSDTAPRVSSTDLAQTQYFSSAATGGNDRSEHAQLFNGVIGDNDSGTSDAGVVRMASDNTVTVTLDTSVHTNGYDLTGITTCFGWNPDNGGRSNQGYELILTSVDGSTSILAGPEHWEPNNPASYWTTVTFTNAPGRVMASRVKAVTFNITQDANAGGVVIAREFDVFGLPSTQDYPNEIVIDSMDENNSMTWATDGTYHYSIQSNVNLILGEWGTFTNVLGTPPATSVVLPFKNEDQMFFRVIVE